MTLAAKSLTVYTATSKQGIDNIAVPNYMQRLKSLFAFIDGFNALTFFGIIIIQNHAIAKENQNPGLFDSESPDE